MAILGTRPEAIKLAPLILRLRHCPWAEVSVCVTGQHRGLLDQMLAVFDLRPDHDLDVMRDDQGLSDTTALTLTRLAPVLAAERPELVLVQGDTTTAFAGALAAFHQRIAVGHLEAGLRTGRRYQPYPEEIHRQMISRLATWHYAPTAAARHNLLSEGVPDEAVLVTGNTIVDALQWIGANLNGRPGDPAGRVVLEPQQRLLLTTAHRRENFGDGLRNVFTALRALVARHDNLVVVYPVHPNPSVDGPARAALAGNPRIRLIEPLDYLSFVALMRRADAIVTDSGGVQEEAPSFGVPVAVTRTTTERPEGIESGVARLVGTDTELIVATVEQYLSEPDLRARLRRIGNPYGDGHASARIADHIEHALRPADVVNGRAIAPV